MTRVAKLNALRSLATAVAAALIFSFNTFLPNLRFALPLSVFVSCLLGGVQGAASVGIAAIVFFASHGANLALMTQTYAGLFAGALVAGLLSGRPSVYEKSVSKTSVKLLVGALIAAVIYFAACALIARDTSFVPYITLDAVKTVAVAVISCVLRPKVATLLFPPDAEEEEIEAAIEKLKKSSLKPQTPRPQGTPPPDSPKDSAGH